MQKERRYQGNLTQQILEQKTLPASSLHRLSHQLRGQRYYPAPDSKHGRLVQVELVNQHINKIENNKLDGLSNLQSHNNMTILYNNKEQSKPQLQPKTCQSKCFAKPPFCCLTEISQIINMSESMS